MAGAQGLRRRRLVVLHDGRADRERSPRRGPAHLQDRHGVQTTVYPAVHELESFRRRLPGVSLPHSEEVAASMFSIPLFPHMGEQTQDEVVAALSDSIGG